jgi:predicted O-methyltransferase YrrM
MQGAILLAHRPTTAVSLGPMAASGLAAYYKELGLSEDAWHLGPEHPDLERLALRVLAESARARILEVGVQAGGFAVPVIAEAAGRSGFAYTGVDALQYTNAVPLRLIANYLEGQGIAGPLRFVEADSTEVLRGLSAESFDLILLDHYKAKYPLDLYIVFARRLLSPGGTILVHDVLAHAAGAWTICERVCAAFGYTWTIDDEVPNGVAIVRKGGAPPHSTRARIIGLEVGLRWRAHSAIVAMRRLAGRSLRALGLRA